MAHSSYYYQHILEGLGNKFKTRNQVLPSQLIDRIFDLFDKCASYIVRAPHDLRAFYG